MFPTMAPRQNSSRSVLLWRAGCSTKWPGKSRLAVPFTVMASLISLAQFGLGVYIAHVWLSVPDAFECWDFRENQPYLSLRPLTIMDFKHQGGRYVFSVDGSSSDGWIMFEATVFPALGALSLFFLLFCHIRGLANNRAIILGLCELMFWLCMPFGDKTISIDSSKVEDWNICETSQAWRFWNERSKRVMLETTRMWLVNGTCLFIITYVICAFYAAYLNGIAADAMSARVVSLELQNIPSRPPNPWDNPISLYSSSNEQPRTFSQIEILGQSHADRRRMSEDEETGIGVSSRLGTEAGRNKREGGGGDPFEDPVNPFADPQYEIRPSLPRTEEKSEK